MKKTTTILTALIAIVSLGFSSTAAGSLLPVIDPGFETGASEQKTDVDQADASRGWFEAYGNSSGQTLLEFEQWEDQGNPDVAPQDDNGTQWGAFFTGPDGSTDDDKTGRLYQQIGTVEAGSMYSVSGIAGRQSNGDFNQLTIELWAWNDNDNAADGTDIAAAGNGTLIDSITLAETSLFGNEDNVIATALFSETLTASGNDGDELWIAFTPHNAGDPVTALIPTSSTFRFTLFDDVSLTIIPEPASFVLLLLGGLAFLGCRRRLA